MLAAQKRFCYCVIIYRVKEAQNNYRLEAQKNKALDMKTKALATQSEEQRQALESAAKQIEESEQRYVNY